MIIFNFIQMNTDNITEISKFVLANIKSRKIYNHLAIESKKLIKG
jgi:hypothetical protein